MDGGASGESPSLERRRERRGTTGVSSEASVGFEEGFSGHGLGKTDVSLGWASASCCCTIDWTVSFLGLLLGGHGSGG